MFLRCHQRKKDGKEHRYYSVEESRRLQSGKVVQRRVLYLGEINDSQQAAWRKTAVAPRPPPILATRLRPSPIALDLVDPGPPTAAGSAQFAAQSVIFP